MNYSDFGKKLQEKSGISLLMDDLGKAMNVNRDMLMLGGGNPAFVPEVQAAFRSEMQKLLADGTNFERAVGVYDTPQGNAAFIESLADLFHREFGWQISSENIALTAGSQSAFFVLFNMFAGKSAGQPDKKILLPLAPEYIGYADIGLEGDIFRSFRPRIEFLPDRLFKYHVNFDELEIAQDVGAVCLSRPTNPTGNVLTDAEITHLISLAQKSSVPLILDNAYGTPFPNIIFTDARPFWQENVIVCMSLSKFGLPGTRTGIIIADKEVIQMVSEFNAVLSLAPNGMGAALAGKLVASGEILHLSRKYIRPFYQQRCQHAVEMVHKYCQGLDYYIHKPEGALFLWLWFKDLAITDEELYQRLKQKGVLVVPGHYFFPGMDQDWQHCHECIRVTYSQSPEMVEAGIKLIAQTVKEAGAELLAIDTGKRSKQVKSSR